MLLLRVALAAVALVACLWFGLGIRQAHDFDRADALVHQPGSPSRSQTNAILALLRHAGALNPDRNVALLRAQAEVRAGESALAEAQMRRVVAAEPMNVDAWIVLGFAARAHDPATARLAAEMERRLAPPVPAGR